MLYYPFPNNLSPMNTTSPSNPGGSTAALSRLPAGSILPLWWRIYAEFARRSQLWGLQPNVCMVLFHLHLHPEESEPAAIAAANFLPRQTMTFILDTLERRKLARREPHASDRRRKVVRPTNKGRKVAEKMFQDLMDVESAALRGLRMSDRRSMMTLLEGYADGIAAQNASDLTLIERTKP